MNRLTVLVTVLVLLAGCSGSGPSASSSSTPDGIAFQLLKAEECHPTALRVCSYQAGRVSANLTAKLTNSDYSGTYSMYMAGMRAKGSDGVWYDKPGVAGNGQTGCTNVAFSARQGESVTCTIQFKELPSTVKLKTLEVAWYPGDQHPGTFTIPAY